MTKDKTSLFADSPQGSSKAYIVATAFLSLFAIVGIAFYGLPFFFDFMSKDFGWSRTTITSGNALGKLLIGPLFGFIAGWLIDRYGPRRLMLVGSLFMGVALIGLGYNGGVLWMFYLCYIFNALGYVCAGPLPCQVLISRWFDKNRGKAMGIAYLGIGVGGTFAPQIAAKLESSFSWNFSLAGLGVLVILVSMPMVFFIKESKRKEETTTKTAESTAVSIKSILTNRNFYLLGLGSMCAIGVVGAISQHLKLYLRDLEYTQSQAANIMSIVLMASLIGRVLMGWLADLFSRKYVMILIYLMVASAIPMLLLPEFPGKIYIFAIIYGIGLGGDYMIIPLMAGDLFGIRALGRVMGIILVADGISESTIPMMVGAMYDSTGNYMLGFTALICIALTGAIIISFIPKKGAAATHNID
jgi:MFS family permease